MEEEEEDTLSLDFAIALVIYLFFTKSIYNFFSRNQLGTRDIVFLMVDKHPQPHSCR